MLANSVMSGLRQSGDKCNSVVDNMKLAQNCRKEHFAYRINSF